MTKTKLTLASIGIMLLPFVVMAQPVADNLSLCGIISGIKNAIWIVFGAIAVIMFVIAGILFLTAGGNPEKVQAARSAFIWGVAGVVVGIIAFSIMAIVGTGIGVGNVGTGC